MSVRAWRPGLLRAWVLAPAVLAILSVTAAPAVAQPNCSTTAQFGACSYPPYLVSQDMWKPGPGSYQMLTAESAGNWQVASYQPTGAPVRSYPNVAESFGQPISDFSAATATFSDHTPAGVHANAGFDIWVNGAPGGSSPPGTEVMIWTNNQGNGPAGRRKATVTMGGQRYGVWECKAGQCFPHAYYAFVIRHNESSGQAPILGALHWLTAHGLIRASEPLSQVQYGWEIRDTGGSTKTFAMTSFSLHTSLKG